jgi:hypothetical protein
MGETLQFIGGSTQEDYKNADAAYDATQNLREEERQDQNTRQKLNEAKANSIDAASRKKKK